MADLRSGPAPSPPQRTRPAPERLADWDVDLEDDEGGIEGL